MPTINQLVRQSRKKAEKKPSTPALLKRFNSLKKKETDQMLLYLQLKNATGNSMLEYIFQAKDYTDFIYRYSIIQWIE